MNSRRIAIRVPAIIAMGLLGGFATLGIQRLGGFGDRLLQLSPVENGWAVIGRTDKYLAAAAVTAIKATRQSITVKLHESGPLGIWLAEGQELARYQLCRQR